MADSGKEADSSTTNEAAGVKIDAAATTTLQTTNDSISKANSSVQTSALKSTTTDFTTLPPITPSILSSLSHEHAFFLIHPLLSPEQRKSITEKSTSVHTLLKELLNADEITPEKFWKAVPLDVIPWSALQGEEFREARLLKMQGGGSEVKKLSREKKKKVVPKMKMSKPAVKKKEGKKPAAGIVLPPPANPPYYTKVEAIQVIEQKPHLSEKVINAMIRQKFVPCKKKVLSRLLQEKTEGKAVEDTPWKVLERKQAKQKSKLQPPKQIEPVPEVPLELPTPSNPPFYTPSEAEDLLSNPPPPPNPPYYTKAQTASFLSKFKKQKPVMELLVKKQLVPASVGQLYKLMKSVKDGKNVATKPWSSKLLNKKRSLENVELKEEGPNAKKRKTIVNQNVFEPFMKQAKTLEDAEFVRHVALEFERRGYSFGLKLGMKNSDEGGDEKTTEKTQGDEKGEEGIESETEKTSEVAIDNKVTQPTVPCILFYPPTTQQQLVHANRWDDMFLELKIFHEENGHLKVPPTHKALHSWVQRQRTQWKYMQEEGMRHSLSFDRIQKLSELGFGSAQESAASVADPEAENMRGAKKEKKWDEKFEELQQYKEIHGTTVVPRHINEALSKWVYKQRLYCKRIQDGDTNTPVTQEKFNKLEELGFDMTGDFKVSRTAQRKRNEKKADVKWEERFNELAEYKARFGNCDVVYKKVKNGDGNDEYKQLASWVSLQRVKYKKKLKGLSFGRTIDITEEQVKRLASIGFNFAGKRLDFEARFRQLQEYARENGHTRVPVFYAERDNLGRWAKRMRDGIRMNEPWVNEIHKARLLGIGFDVEARQVFDHPIKPKAEEIHLAELDMT